MYTDKIKCQVQIKVLDILLISKVELKRKFTVYLVSLFLEIHFKLKKKE